VDVRPSVRRVVWQGARVAADHGEPA
jgi:hypothetical protein